MNKTIQKYFFIMLAAVLLHPLVLAQTTVTFTNAAATGRNGPTQAQVNTAYDGTTLDDDVTVSSGIQLWTVPATATYTIEVWGAEGGDATSFTGTGGKGARMKGDFTLTQGTVLKIIVGQSGASQAYDGAGGGGSFVVTGTNTAIIIAGGGGGGSSNTNGGEGLTGTSGGTSPGNTSGYGGTNGNGASTNSNAAGGGGLLTDGGYGTNAHHKGYAFVNGGAGGDN